MISAQKTQGWLILGLAFVAIAEGSIGRLFEPGRPLGITYLSGAVVGMALIFSWYAIDAKQRNFKRSIPMDIGVVGLAIVALPYYFFSTRGVRGGLIATAVFLLLSIASWLLTAISARIVWVVLQHRV